MTREHPYSYNIRNQDQFSTANPAANTPITFLDTEGQRHEILIADFSLVTDANVADREVRIEIDYASTTTIIGRSPSIQTAGQTKFYTVQAGTANFVDSGGQHNIISIPARITLPFGATLRITAYNLQAGDDFTAANIITNAYKEMA